MSNPFNKIRIRDDDVLISSKGFAGREFARFKGFHNVVLQDPKHFIHVGAILTTEIQEFPECIEFIKQETAAGRFLPETHGLKHIDYANLSFDEIGEHLNICRKFIQDNFNYNPTIFYSPWGAGADARGAHIRPAAAAVGFQLVTCEHMIHPHRLVEDVNLAKEGKVLSSSLLTKWEGKEILRHWWEGANSISTSTLYFKDLS